MPPPGTMPKHQHHHHTKISSTAKGTIYNHPSQNSNHQNHKVTKQERQLNNSRLCNNHHGHLHPTADPTKQPSRPPRCTNMEQISGANHKEKTQKSQSQTLRKAPNKWEPQSPIRKKLREGRDKLSMLVPAKHHYKISMISKYHHFIFWRKGNIFLLNWIRSRDWGSYKSSYNIKSNITKI